MMYKIERKTIAPQVVAYGTGSGPATEIPKILGEVLPKAMQHVKSKDGELAGPPFTHYLSMGETIELQAGVPLRGKISGSDSVEIGELPGGDVLTTVHVGPYDQLNKAYQALVAHVQKHDLTPGDTIWEYYWTDPEAEEDPSNWKTEIFLPLK